VAVSADRAHNLLRKQKADNLQAFTHRLIYIVTDRTHNRLDARSSRWGSRIYGVRQKRPYLKHFGLPHGFLARVLRVGLKIKHSERFALLGGWDSADDARPGAEAELLVQRALQVQLIVYGLFY
jgi:hypothetical protein